MSHVALQHKGGRLASLARTSFDEMGAPEGPVREAYRAYREWLEQQDGAWMRRQGLEAETVFRRTGITFNVYGEDAAEVSKEAFQGIPSLARGAPVRSDRRLSRNHRA